MNFKGFGERDEDSDEVLATFGILRSDIVDMLASIRISINGLEEVLATNPDLNQTDTALILVAIDNAEELYEMFTLGGEIKSYEVSKVVRKIRSKVDLLNQVETLRNNMMQKDVERKDKTFITHTEAPDVMMKGLFGDEYT